MRFLLAAILFVASLPAQDFTEVEKAAADEITALHIPGVAIGVVRNGKLIYTKGIGTANLEHATPITSETLFRLGSTTKMMTAAAVATLAAQGKMDLNGTVGQSIKGLDPAIAALTVTQILSHTAGLMDEAIMNGRHDDAALGDEIRLWKSPMLFTSPGKIYSYSNPGYWLAGYVAETVFGKPYAETMDALVFQPLGMTSSTLRPLVAMTHPLSQGHDLVGKELSVLRPAPDNTANWPAGSVFSNLDDLSRLTVALMNQGRIDGKQALPAKAVEAMTTPHAAIPGSGASYGFGLTVSPGLWTHNGSRAGYGSRITMAPDKQTAYILLANRTGASLPKTEKALNAALGMPANPPAKTLPKVADPTGTFRNGAAEIRIVARDGEFYMTRNSQNEAKLSGVIVIPGPDGHAAYIHNGGRAFAKRIE